MQNISQQIVVAVTASILTAALLAGGAAIGRGFTGLTAEVVERLLTNATKSDLRRAVDVVQTTVVARTPEQPRTREDGSDIWLDQHVYVAPRVPDDPTSYLLDLECPAGMEPVTAWTEVGTSHPGRDDQFYTIGASVDRETDRIRLALRSRGDRTATAAYAYVDVYALCRFSS